MMVATDEGEAGIAAPSEDHAAIDGAAVQPAQQERTLQVVQDRRPTEEGAIVVR